MKKWVSHLRNEKEEGEEKMRNERREECLEAVAKWVFLHLKPNFKGRFRISGTRVRMFCNSCTELCGENETRVGINSPGNCEGRIYGMTHNNAFLTNGTSPRRNRTVIQLSVENTIRQSSHNLLPQRSTSSRLPTDNQTLVGYFSFAHNCRKERG